MRTLIVDDDQVCRTLLVSACAPHGPTVEASTGRAAVEAVRNALLIGQPFDAITLDIMMPDMDGQAALMAIRSLEAANGLAQDRIAKVLMTTALSDGQNVLAAFREQCHGYLIKPVKLDKLYGELARLGLIRL
jgi:two-component system chemotaxis response regulator CheY